MNDNEAKCRSTVVLGFPFGQTEKLQRRRVILLSGSTDLGRAGSGLKATA